MRANELIPLIATNSEVWVCGGRYWSAGIPFYGHAEDETEEHEKMLPDFLVRDVWLGSGDSIRMTCFDFPNMSEWDKKQRAKRPKEILMKLARFEKRFKAVYLSEEGRRRLEQYKAGKEV